MIRWLIFIGLLGWGELLAQSCAVRWQGLQDEVPHEAVDWDCHQVRQWISQWIKNQTNQGFPMARAFVEQQNDSLVVTLEPGMGWVWGNPLPNQVWMRWSGIRAGEPVRLDLLEKARQRLARVSWLHVGERVAFYRVSRRNQLIPVFDIYNQSSQEVELWGMVGKSAARDSSWQWQGLLRITLNNPWNRGREFSLTLERLEEEQLFDFSLKWPWLWSSDWGGIAKIQWGTDSVSQWMDARAGIERDLSLNLRMSLLGGYELWQENEVEEGKKILTVDMEWNYLDREPLPRQGWKMDGKLEAGQTELWNNSDSTRSFLRLHVKWFRRCFLSRPWSWGIVAEEEWLYPRTTQFRSSEWLTRHEERFYALWPKELQTNAIQRVEWMLGVLHQDWLLEGFAEAGLTRNLGMLHGWQSRYGYGLRFQQDNGRVGSTVVMSWSPQRSLLEGLLAVRVQSRF